MSSDLDAPLLATECETDGKGDIHIAPHRPPAIVHPFAFARVRARSLTIKLSEPARIGS